MASETPPADRAPQGSAIGKILSIVLGRPLASSEQDGRKIGVFAGLPALGLDGLSSCAYGPEAALAILAPLGLVGLRYILPITFLILALLLILYFSYRQTISAYPANGGSYTVAKENLGKWASFFSAAALMIDYILTVAVGISAGIAALVSAVPSLHPYTLTLCLAVLGIITIANLRGTSEAGVAFAVWVAAGGFPPAAPAVPYVRALTHTVPHLTGLLAVGKLNGSPMLGARGTCPAVD
jgi:amino acid transporter